MLRAEPDAAFGIVVAAECQTVGSALPVVDVGESGGVAADRGGQWGGNGGGDNWCGNRRGDTGSEGGSDGGNRGRARQTTATIISTRAIGRTVTAHEGNETSCEQREFWIDHASMLRRPRTPSKRSVRFEAAVII